MKSVREANSILRLEKISHASVSYNMSPMEMCLGDPTWSGPDCPPGFEDVIEVVGLPQTGSAT